MASGVKPSSESLLTSAPKSKRSLMMSMWLFTWVQSNDHQSVGLGAD